MLLLMLGVGMAAMALLGRNIVLPVWAVAELEERINLAMKASGLPPGSTISIDDVEIGLAPDLAPRFVLRDLRLREGEGRAGLVLPEIRMELAPAPLLRGELRPRLLRLSAARIAMARDENGLLTLDLAGLTGGKSRPPAELLAAIEQVFTTGPLSVLKLIEMEGLAFSLKDARAGRTWELGDGRLVLENRADALAAELSLTQLGTPARASMLVESSKQDASARLSVTFDHVASRDLAAQAVPLAMLEVIDAPISGALRGALDASGKPAGLEAELTLAAGALRPGEGEAIALSRPEPGDAPPVPRRRVLEFDRAALRLRYDSTLQRVFLDQMNVESPSARLQASGTVDLMDAGGAPLQPGALPESAVTQLRISELMVDPEGLFAAPVRFSAGSASWRLWLRPFRVEIGEVNLLEGEERLSLRGEASVLPGEGWSGAIDVALNQISTDRLIRLWPLAAVPKTRSWLAENVGQGELTDVAAALRFKEGSEPHFALDYEFSGAEVRVIRSLPPVQNGYGRATLMDRSYTVVIEGGEITAPDAGDRDARIRVDGSLFRVPDITQKPASAEVRLLVEAGLTATLSLLDQEPFRFITKAGQKVGLGEGRAHLVADLAFPLKQKIAQEDVSYSVSGRVTDFRSQSLVPGKLLESPDLAVKVTRKGLSISGAGKIEGVPAVARYEQPFGKETGGAASLRGTVRLSDAGLRRLGVALPAGWLKGETGAEVQLRLARGRPAELSLTSDLKGATLAVPPLSWSKAAATGGKLSLDAVLGAAPVVPRLDLSAAGLDLHASLTTATGGGLGKMEITRLRVGDWLDATAELSGRGRNTMPAVKLTGGSLDLRHLPKGGSAGASGGGRGDEISVSLDRLVVTEGISLTGLSGNLRPVGAGLEGGFVAAVNGAGQVQGATIAYKGGTAVRLTSQDAGRIMAAAGIFSMGRGGSLDMTIQPRDVAGQYSGVARVENFRVENAPILAELLSAASVVGLLEQLQGGGIAFQEGDVSFLILPEGVQIARGAAIGASMGISFSGFYHAARQAVEIQGTISPIYLLNGIGSIFTRKGEGLFGFNYRLSGPVKSPSVSVNPLSILTPGMFRDIFRRPAPVLKGAG
ncbi:hypothetical protein [Pseudogemmobacter faecipullorum]|uniref:AsmA-like C-terminal domain-containing protein n=1 Tax=Pseudogemmobacter faecipullorum TaxID=2755041 RepID=A0ABS8CJ26_9RHOB|nr:hypothetical protein [Pseudogemmobacter faecipullorum]MCB5409375.1 hypothetical protein [Pseudogemmobacter faecipullorum]